MTTTEALAQKFSRSVGTKTLSDGGGWSAFGFCCEARSLRELPEATECHNSGGSHNCLSLYTIAFHFHTTASCFTAVSRFTQLTLVSQLRLTSLHTTLHSCCSYFTWGTYSSLFYSASKRLIDELSYVVRRVVQCLQARTSQVPVPPLHRSALTKGRGS